MAKSGVPPNAALVQSTPVFAVLGKLVFLQAIAILCTNRLGSWAESLSLSGLWLYLNSVQVYMGTRI